MSHNAMRTALRRMGYSNDEMTSHGFRAMARMIMVEKLNMSPDVIEMQLARSTHLRGNQRRNWAAG